ncbi:hypothetical protein LMG33818_002602 [Halomonadaceae bacterium LMG 33818]
MSSKVSSEAELSGGMVTLFAAASGLAVANIYYAQPLIALITPELGIPPSIAGLIVAFTQLGYGLGLLFLVPVADVLENRRLIVRLMIGIIVGLIGIALSHASWLFLVSCGLVGICSVAAQVLVPMASHLSTEKNRGRVVGNVMAGLLGGIMLARPFSSFIADILGWRAVFWITAALMVVTALLLQRRLPQRFPCTRHRYSGIIKSLPGIFLTTSLLRRRALYQGMMFAAFNLFWTASPLLLIHEFHFSQSEVALFSLAGAGGALSAPLAGRLADRGLSRIATGSSLFIGLCAFIVAGWSGNYHHLMILILAAIVLDACVQVCQVLSLRSLYMLAPELRGRLNGIFMTCVFICGALGSGFSAALYTHGGWIWVTTVGTLCPLVALLAFFTERKAHAG